MADSMCNYTYVVELRCPGFVSLDFSSPNKPGWRRQVRKWGSGTEPRQPTDTLSSYEGSALQGTPQSFWVPSSPWLMVFPTLAHMFPPSICWHSLRHFSGLQRNTNQFSQFIKGLGILLVHDFSPPWDLQAQRAFLCTVIR